MTDSADLNRRRFLQSAAVAAISLPVLNVLSADAEADPTSQPSKGPIDVGPLKSYATNGVTSKWARSNRIFVIVEGGKLYAPSATCTHKGCVLTPNTAKDLYCKCHRSSFTLEGYPTSGPAKYPLARYAVSVNDSGNVIVDKTKSFDEPQWGSADSFIEIKA